MSSFDRVRALFPRSRRRVRADVDAEIAMHLEMRIAELVQSGMDPVHAREEALRRFGDLHETRQYCIDTDQRRETRMQKQLELVDVRADIRIAWRQVWRRPAFALTVIMTLALGIGATTTIFSVADHVVLRPLPYSETDRVMTVWSIDRVTGESHKPVSPAEFVAWSEQSNLATAWGLAEPSGFDLTSREHPMPVSAFRVTSGFFDALGVRPVIGSLLAPSDFLGTSPRAVMISYELWQREFGGSAAIVGRTIALDGEGVEVRGVLPPEATYPEAADVWAPRAISGEERRDYDSGYMFAVARTRPHVTAEALGKQLSVISDRGLRDAKGQSVARRAAVVPVETQVLGPARPALAMISGAVCFLLLIACTNVAALLIARNQERSREIAVRSALGAGRRRLIRHMLAEAAVLCLAGAVCGVGLAYGATRAITVFAPADLPRSSSIHVDLRVLCFAALAAFATFLLCGLPAAVRSSRVSLNDVLRNTSRSLHGAREVRAYRHILVTVEIALAVVLMVGAGLLARSFVALLANDAGFVADGRATIQLFLWDRNPTPEQRVARAQEIERAFLATPGVIAVGATTAAPFHPHRIASKSVMTVVGAEGRDAEERISGIIVTPGYFDALGIPLLQGRALSPSDRMGGAAVAVLNESAARAYFPGMDPIGRRVRFGVMGAPAERVVVGVVADTRAVAYDEVPVPEVFIPLSQSGNGGLTFVVHGRGNLEQLVASLQQAVWRIDPGQSVYHAASLPSMMAESLATKRFYLILLAAFSMLALLLSGVGLYGLVSYATRARAGEIGVRLALGARARSIAAMVLRDGMYMALPGLAAGALGAMWLTRFMQSMLYNVKPSDPLTFVATLAILLVLAAVGSYIPARRAAGSDPAAALRG